MAVAPEDMNFEQLEAVCDGYMCRALPAPYVSAALPRGSWNHVNFPMIEIQDGENPMVHFLEVVAGYTMQTSFEDLGLHYKRAITHQDLQLLPHPFGPKIAVASQVKMQLVIVEEDDGTATVFKHYMFPNKAKASFVKNLAFGTLYKPSFMSQKPTVGKKILQYCLQNMGGRQFRCFDLSAETAASQAKLKAFEELDDDALECGFEFLRKNAPRSGSDLQQLSWQTKEIRKKSFALLVHRRRPCAQGIRLAPSLDREVLPEVDLGEAGEDLELRCGCFSDAGRT